MLENPNFLNWVHITKVYANAGENIKKTNQQGYLFFSIKPKQKIFFATPKNSFTKIITSNPLAKFSVWRSNGTNLWKQLQYHRQGDSFILAPDLNNPGVISIHADRKTSIVILETHSRPIPNASAFKKTIKPYNGIQSQAIEKLGQRVSTDYWMMGATMPLKFNVTGPSYIQLSFIAPKNPYNNSSSSRYFISSRLDNHPYQSISTESFTVGSNIYFLHNKPVIGSALDQQYLFIPRGDHQLTLRSMSPLFTSIHYPGYKLLVKGMNSSYILPIGNKSGNILNGKAYIKTLANIQHSEWINNYSNSTTDTYLQTDTMTEHSPYNLRLKNARALSYTIYSRYQDLLPTKNLRHVNLLNLYNLPIKYFYDRPDMQLSSNIFSKSYMHYLLSTVQRSEYLQLPQNKAEALEFSLPDSNNAKQIRARIYETKHKQAAVIEIQIDSQQKRKLFIQKPPELLTPLLSAREIGNQSSKANVTAKFFRTYFDGQLPYQQPESVEIWLPKHSKQIKIWVNGKSKNINAYLNLQLLVKQPHELNEQEYYYISREAARSNLWQSFTSFMKNKNLNPSYPPTDNASLPDMALWQMDNNWLLLKQHLASQRLSLEEQYRLDIADNHASELKVRSIYEQMSAYLKKNKISNQASIINSINSNPHYQNQNINIIQKTTELLSKLGYKQTAINLLKSNYLYSKKSNVRDYAYNQLLQYYNELNNRAAISQLIAYQAYQKQSPQAYNDLAEQLTTQRKFYDALMIEMAIPYKQQNIDTLLTNTYELNWWRLFDSEIDRIKDRRHFSRWLGYRDIYFGNFDAAIYHLRSEPKFQKALKSYIASLDKIDHCKKCKRSISIDKLKQFESTLPGPYVYSNARWTLKQTSGFINLKSPTENVLSLAYSEANTSTQYQITGPATIELSVRPLYLNNRPHHQASWLNISDNGKYLRLPIINNQISSTYPNRYGNRFWIGQNIIEDIKLGPGRHNLKLNSNQLAIASKVLIKRSILPMYFSDIVSNKFHSSLKPMPKQGNRRIFIYHNYRSMPKFHTRKAKPSREFSRTEIIPSKIQQSTLHLQDKAESQMSTILYNIEHRGKNPMPLLIKALFIAEKHKDNYMVNKIWTQLRRHLEWKYVPQVNSPAGNIQKVSNQWQPETPGLAIIKSLALVNKNQQLINYNSRLNLNIETTGKAKLNISFSQKNPFRLAPIKATVRYQLSMRPSRTISLGPNRQQRQISIDLPPGKHSFSCTLDNPVLGQYVAVSANLIQGNQSTTLAPKSIKSYFITTKQQPVHAYVAGPSVLMVMSTTNGMTKIFYKAIKPGMQNVQINPDHGNKSLIRVFRMVAVSNPVDIQRRQAHNISLKINSPQYLTQALPAGLLLSNLAKAENSVGTWQLNAGFDMRFSSTADDSAVEKFGNLSVSYFRYLADHSRYYMLTGTSRWPLKGEPVYGFESSVDQLIIPTLKTPAFRLWLDLSGYSQESPHTGQLYSLHSDFGIKQRRQLTSKISHTPFIGIFVNQQFGGSVNTNDLSRMDQDVYSPYYNNHEVGLRIGDDINYQPTWDSSFDAGVTYETNENLSPIDPNALISTISWSQLMGPVTSSFLYENKYYFKGPGRDKNSMLHRLYWELDFYKKIKLTQILSMNLIAGINPRTSDKIIGLEIKLLNDNQQLAFKDLTNGDLRFKSLRQRIAASDNLEGLAYGD